MSPEVSLEPNDESGSSVGGNFTKFFRQFKVCKKNYVIFFFVKFSGRSTRSGRRDSLSPDSAKEDGNFPQFFVKSLFREFNAIFLEYEKHLAYGNSRKTYFTYST